MDSLLANYASSDEEQEEASVEQRTNPPPNQKEAKKIEVEGKEIEDFLSENTSKSIKFSLPPPKSSSSFSLNPPKSHQHKQEDSDDDDRELQRVENRENSKPSSLSSSLPQPKSSSSLFSSLPPPKSHVTDPQPSPSPKRKPNTAPDPVSGTSAKRVVQFRPPLNPSLGKYRDFDDEDEDEDEYENEKEKRREKAESSGQTASVKSFLSSIPAPKNSATLGALPSASGTGKRSIVETSNSSSVSEVGVSGNMGGDNDGGQYVDGAPMSSSGGVSGSLDYAVGGGSSSGGDYSNWGAGNENYVNYDGNTGYGNVDYSNWSAANGDHPSYGSGSGSYSKYGQYENNWSDGSTTMPVESELRLSAKRGRKDVPPQIVEVNQDELMKNRPREDQAKLTGIAFGPSYQPVSTKGKPTKLHKRKHQIGSLYFDMKQKEMELAERRAKGFLTKAQTQGKYGW